MTSLALDRARDQPSASTRSPAVTGLDGSRERALLPAITLPKGGGAIRGIGEKFGANPVTGTGSMSVPIAVPASRFGPSLALSYDSGGGNGPFGLGWSLSVPAITRKTDKGLPRYSEADESDVFILSDAEDLVPVLVQREGAWARDSFDADAAGVAHTVQRYRPRVEGLFARIERWTSSVDGTAFWKTISKDNVTSLFGVTSDGRIVDPDRPTHIFKWLLQRTYDDKGNVVVYDYVAENHDGVSSAAHEVHRAVGAQRYLSRIRYGNTTPYYPDSAHPETLALPGEWFFHIVFDYGDHDLVRPRIDPDIAWPARLDPFSTYRAGFEVRTYRLCRRVLAFHNFPELGTTPCLVRSTDLRHTADASATRLSGVRQTAYRRNPADQSYTILDPATEERLSPRSLPELEFTYSIATVDDTVRVVARDALENLPSGVDGTRYRWVDLDSEGLPGVLSEQADAWFYRRNTSNLPRDDSGAPVPSATPGARVRAAFDPLELVATRPSLAALATGRQQFVDLAGEGKQSLVQFDRPFSGYYGRTDDGEWRAFTPFASSPNIDWTDPDLRTLDLDGDGHSDILISGDEVFTWYASLGADGFAPAATVRRALDEDDGPALVFSDAAQSIYLADMSGDGLTDLVRIRNGETCYWPNIGFGRFGAKVVMSNAPVFDAPDQFDQSRIRLADIDGSGTTDIIYLGRGEVVLYFNQSGNAWSEPRVLTEFPLTDDLATVAPIDLLGNGTACLVWSSPLPSDAGAAMRYVDLMGGQKPHLLVGVKNNLGAETTVHYAASTRFYLEDRLAGRPWRTKLPFPVHVVDRVDVLDTVSQTRFVSRYAYHHGYFDGAEREFRGFAMVEQWDSEAFAAFGAAANVDEATFLPPVLTRTWFHTGAWLQDTGVPLSFRDEYYREPGLTDDEFHAMLLPDTVLPTVLTTGDGSTIPWRLSPVEEREACRSLKGATLRQEIYALDGTPAESRPFSVSERSFTIQLLQPRANEQHAVCFTHARETIDLQYERALYDIGGEQLADPRVSHAMTLAVDVFGNPLRTAVIGYGRRYNAADPDLTVADIAKQRRLTAAFTEMRYTNAIDAADQYRTPAPAESRMYELLHVTPQAALAHTTNLFLFDEVQRLIDAAGDGQHEVSYEDLDAMAATGAGPYRRLIDRTRTLYRADDISGPLPVGAIDALALPYESYHLALTPGLLALLSAKISSADATALLTGSAGGYRDLDGDGHLWVPSGRMLFSDDPANPDAAFAREHRFLPQGALDAFGNMARVSYDPHELFVAQTMDAAGNTVTAISDYRVLQPSEVTDPNGNRTAVAYDVFGFVAGTAVMGKVDEPDGIAKGDVLDDFAADLTDSQRDAFFDDPRRRALSLLGGATSRIVYDVNRYATTGGPTFAATVQRETHVADVKPGEQTKVQVSVSYSDGFGREIQKKLPATSGPVEVGGAIVDPRWVGSGWTIFNNKGKPVRQYEPFFTATHGFELAVERGVSPTLLYDAAGRVAATLHPDHSYDKVVFDPWRQVTWDVNDTVTRSPTDDADVAPWFARLDSAECAPSWYALRTDAVNAALFAQRWPDATSRADETAAANKAAANANTPAVAHMDSLGRTVVTIADNAADGRYATQLDLDIQGNVRSVVDALGRTVTRSDVGMLGRSIHHVSMDAGERWLLSDAMGASLRAWDSRGHTFLFERDALRRPTRSVVRGADANDPVKEILYSNIEYGEGQPKDQDLNLRGRPFRQYDTAGVASYNKGYDFKGNALGTTRQLVHDYTTAPDWSGNPDLEQDVFASSTTYDALNRATSVTTPDGSTARPEFNEANLLERLSVSLQGSATATQFVTRIDYDAKSRRTSIDYGNGARTEYEYDPTTFRLVHLSTARNGVQDLRYAYDPVGNVTSIRDDAQQTVYFNNAVVSPRAEYVYDALYRLIGSTGREHIGQAGSPETTWSDRYRVRLPHPQDGSAMRNYAEQYDYDAVGNIESLIHRATNGDWRRDYSYLEPSLIEPAVPNNRLTRTAVGATIEGYSHDVHGNVTAMPQLAAMTWDFRERFQSADLGGGGTAFYVYNEDGQRIRKVIEAKGGGRLSERIYLNGYEVYREYDGTAAVVLERQTLHIADSSRRIAIVETRTAGIEDGPPQLIRYQLANHLGSASLELDETGQVISYEEYYPYGSTSYQAGRSQVDVSLKRYRYTGKERDDETGFTYHGARYYAPWLGRWTSVDPSGRARDGNRYAYANNNPIALIDPDGRDPAPPNLDKMTAEEVNARYQLTPDEEQKVLKKITPPWHGPTARQGRAKTPEEVKQEYDEKHPSALRSNMAEMAFLSHAVDPAGAGILKAGLVGGFGVDPTVAGFVDHSISVAASFSSSVPSAPVGVVGAPAVPELAPVRVGQTLEMVTLYHGAAEPFADPIKPGEGRADDLSSGFYLSNDPAVADTYATHRARQVGDEGRGAVFKTQIPQYEIDLAQPVDVRPGGEHAAAWQEFLDQPSQYPRLKRGEPTFYTNREVLSGETDYIITDPQRGTTFEQFLKQNNRQGADVKIGSLGDEVSGGIGPPYVTDQYAISNPRVLKAMEANKMWQFPR